MNADRTPAEFPAVYRHGKFRLRFDASPSTVHGEMHWEVQIYNRWGLFVQRIFRGWSFAEVEGRALDWVRLHDAKFRINEELATRNENASHSGS